MEKKNYEELRIFLYHLSTDDVFCGASQEFIENENGDDGENNIFG